MRLNQLRVFLTIIDSGSIRGAARQLGVTQPAITKTLRQLEESLHVRLLDRTQHGVVPTLAGRAFAIYADMFGVVWTARQNGGKGDWDELDRWSWQQKLALHLRCAEAYKNNSPPAG